MQAVIGIFNISVKL